MALEHLLISLPEVFREKGVNDGVHGGVAVGQAVGSDPEEEGGGGQREHPKLSPEMDDVVGQPGDPEDHHHHQHRLCGLGEGKEAEALITTGEKGRKQRRWSQQAGAQHPSSCTDRGNFLYIFTESSAS